MTTVEPIICLACTRLDQTTSLPTTCTAYPTSIPEDILAGADEHRRARGDEVNALIFRRRRDRSAQLVLDHLARNPRGG